MSEATRALNERGDRVEKLDKTTADLQNDAQNNAEMAKKLKQKKSATSASKGVLIGS